MKNDKNDVYFYVFFLKKKNVFFLKNVTT